MLLRRFGRGVAAAPPSGGSGTPLADAEHPRLFVTLDNRAAYQTKLAGDWATEYAAYVAEAETHLSESTSSIDDTFAADLFSCAFIYAVGNVSGINYGTGGKTYATYGLRAVDLVEGWRTNGTPALYTPMLVLQLAYDWCYSLLNSTQRAAIVTYLETIPSGVTNCPWDYYDTGARLMPHIVAGLAFANDGIDNATAATMYGKYNTRFRASGTGTLDAYSFFSGTTGGFANLNTYASVEMTGMMPLFMTLEAWRTANDLTKAATFEHSSAAVLQTAAEWLAYRIRPWGRTTTVSAPGGRDYVLVSDGVNQNSPSRSYWAFGAQVGMMQWVKCLTFFHGTAYENTASLAKWILTNRVKDSYPNVGYGYGQFGSQIWSDFIFGDKGAVAASPSSLGMSLTHKDGLGLVVMMTAWDDPDASYVTFDGTPWHRGSSGTSDPRTGSPTIDRKGPLLVTAGTGGHTAFSWSIAGNIPFFVDPAETPKGSTGGNWALGTDEYPTWDQGGQRKNSSGAETSTAGLVVGGEHDFGGISRYKAADAATNRDCTYIYEDMTNAYNSSGGYWDGVNTKKVDFVIREFVYFQKQSSGGNDTVIVFDRQQTTDTKYIKHNLWHLSQDPTITNSGTTTAVRTGLTTYGVASLAVITNTDDSSDGRMFITPLLPSSVSMWKVGGPNGSGQWLSYAGTVHDSHEFEDMYGHQLWDEFGDDDSSAFTAAQRRQYHGPYRVEIVPTTPSLYDNLLTVLEFGNAAATQSTTELLSGTNFKAARVANRIAVFADTNTTRTSGTLTFATAGTYNVLWCDLSGGTRTFTGGTGVTSITSAIDGSGSSGASFTVDASGTVYLTITTTGSNRVVTLS